MKLLSVDLGTRNLAWCVLTREASTKDAWKEAPFCGSEVHILNWTLVDVVEEGRTEEETAFISSDDVNINDLDVAKLVPWFTAVLTKYTAQLTDGIDIALLEAQPTGRFMGGKTVSNIKTKVLSHILQSFLLDHGVKIVQFISPKTKLKHAQHLMEDVNDYREHKKAARTLTLLCLDQLERDHASPWKAWYVTKKGKKDDLADAFLQGVCAALPKPKKARKRKSVDPEAPPKKTAKKLKMDVALPSAPDVGFLLD